MMNPPNYDWLYFILSLIALLFGGYVIVGALLSLASWMKKRLARGPSLNRCSRCGQRPFVREHSYGGFLVECHTCGEGTTPWATVKQAGLWWNRLNPLAKSRGA